MSKAKPNIDIGVGFPYVNQWVEETQQKVEVAIEQLDRGEGIDGEVVIERLRSKLRQAREVQG